MTETIRRGVGKRFPTYLGTAIVVALAMTVCTTGLAQAVVRLPYVGDETCKICHPDHYGDYMLSGHPYKLNFTGGVEPVGAWPFTDVPPLPASLTAAGKTWADTSYVIGNYFWKARWVDENGFIYSGPDTQWNVPHFDEDGALVTGGNYVAYHNGEAWGTKDYGLQCARCHTTGYDPGLLDTNGDPFFLLDGIAGSWQQPGVRCEACHGPGELHATSVGQDPLPGGKDCDDCHYRDAAFRMPWKGGFMRHHEQGEEFAHSPHADVLICENCHNPHKSSVYELGGTKPEADCSNCHAGDDSNNNYVVRGMEDIACIDCHMPDLTKNAVAANPFKGDVRGHIFRIMTDPIAREANVTDLDGDGKLYWNVDAAGQAAVTLDYACLGCHYDNGVPLTLAGAATFAKGIHTRNPYAPPGGIDGTAHDFDRLTAEQDEDGCIVCHDGPRWNHTESAVATYATSTSTVAGGPLGVPQPDAVSGKCLDCHDGTVPVDAFGGAPGDDATKITGHENLTDDLRSHHPVGFTYDANLVADAGLGQNLLYDPNALEPYRYVVDAEGNPTTIKALLLNGGDQVKCTTCHNQHTHFQANNPENEEGRYSHVTTWGKFVKFDHLCFMCHRRYQVDVVGRDVLPTTTQTQVNLDGVVTNGHHFPGRDDPYGVARGGAAGSQEFACFMCHDIEDNGPHELGDPHNSPCVDCHREYDPIVDDSPADSSQYGHHGIAGGDRNDPLVTCAPCHADENGMLAGASFAGTQTPGCNDCHADIWSATPLSVSVADAAGAAGEDVTLTALVDRLPPFVAGEEITLMWVFGDESSPRLPLVSVYQADGSWLPALAVTRAFAADTSGYATVTDTVNPPDVDSFDVTISQAGGPGDDTWAIDPLTNPDFVVTFEEHDGSLVGVTDTGQLSFGIELDGVIFWMDLWMDLSGQAAWGVGDMYFGNINRAEGTMNGIVFPGVGDPETFLGDAL